MISALLRKELRQHTGLFALLACVLVFGLMLVSSNAVFSRGLGSGFAGLKFLLCTMLPLGAMLLGNALIASEFRHKTQLFLEGLPVPRWKLLAVKYATMLGALLLVTLVLLAGAWLGGRQGEAMTLRFAALLGSKTLLWIGCVTGFFFALAFLGRYRIAVMVFVFLGLMWMQPQGVFDLDRSAPFALLDDRFAFERYDWPVRTMLVTAAWTVAFTALGFMLGSVRDSTVASLLAEKMSSREKIVLTLVSVAGIVAVSMAHNEHSNRESVHLPGATTHERGPLVRVEITSTRQRVTATEEEALKLAGTQLADELEDFSRHLGGVSLPTVFVVHRPLMNASELESGNLEFSQGTLVRANVLDPSGNRARLHEWVMSKVLEAKTSGRSQMEPWAWVSDGLLIWWHGAKTGQPRPPSAASIAAARQAAKKTAFSARSFHEWFYVREVAGRKDADALAAIAFHAIASEKGPDAVWRFARECFGAGVAKDARGWWRDQVNPPEARLRRATGLTFEQLAARVQKDLAAR
jgi:hypothetical protein